jgi:uncharacterized membrane protein YfcA
LVPGNIAALPAYRKELGKIGRSLIPLIAVAAIGGLFGALALIYLGGDIFASAVPYLMAFATILFATAPYLRKTVQRLRGVDRADASYIAMILLFGFSVYGGYFGAGLGQIMLAALILMGYTDFHEANALKNAVISAISLLSVVVYGLSGAVSWPHALVMMVGATIGGFLGGTVSKFVPQQVLRFSVIVFGVFLTSYYFYADL